MEYLWAPSFWQQQRASCSPRQGKPPALVALSTRSQALGTRGTPESWDSSMSLDKTKKEPDPRPLWESQAGPHTELCPRLRCEPGNDATVLIHPNRGGAGLSQVGQGDFPATNHRFGSSFSVRAKETSLASCCPSLQLLPMAHWRAAGLPWPWCMAGCSCMGDAGAHHPMEWAQHSCWPAPTFKIFIFLIKQAQKDAPLRLWTMLGFIDHPNVHFRN